MECFKKQILLTYICVYWINKIKFYKMRGTYIKMPIQSLVLRNETLWRTLHRQSKQTQEFSPTLWLQIKHKIHFKAWCQIFTIHGFNMFRPDNIQWPKQVWEKTNIVQHLGNKNLCVCIPLLSTIALQNIFHSNQHTCNYLSKSNAHDVLRICRTCDVFNIVEKCKPQLQCIKSDTLYMDIQRDPWQVIQEGYKTISWWWTHTAKELIHRHYEQ